MCIHINACYHSVNPNLLFLYKKVNKYECFGCGKWEECRREMTHKIRKLSDKWGESKAGYEVGVVTYLFMHVCAKMCTWAATMFYLCEFVCPFILIDSVCHLQALPPPQPQGYLCSPAVRCLQETGRNTWEICRKAHRQNRKSAAALRTISLPPLPSSGDILLAAKSKASAAWIKGGAFVWQRRGPEAMLYRCIVHFSTHFKSSSQVMKLDF